VEYNHVAMTGVVRHGSWNDEAMPRCPNIAAS